MVYVNNAGRLALAPLAIAGGVFTDAVFGEAAAGACQRVGNTTVCPQTYQPGPNRNRTYENGAAAAAANLATQIAAREAAERVAAQRRQWYGQPAYGQPIYRPPVYAPPPIIVAPRVVVPRQPVVGTDCYANGVAGIWEFQADAWGRRQLVCEPIGTYAEPPPTYTIPQPEIVITPRSYGAVTPPPSYYQGSAVAQRVFGQCADEQGLAGFRFAGNVVVHQSSGWRIDLNGTNHTPDGRRIAPESLEANARSISFKVASCLEQANAAAGPR